MSNRNTRTSTPVKAPEAAPESVAHKVATVLGIKAGTIVNPSEKLPDSIRVAAHKAVEGFWDGWFAKGGAADKLAAVEKAREEYEGAAKSLSAYVVGMAVDAFRINGPDVSKASNLFLAMCDEGESHLKSTARWSESATVQSKEAKSLSDAIPQWKVYKSQCKAGIVAGIMGKLVDAGEVTLYAINKAVKEAKGGNPPAGQTAQGPQTATGGAGQGAQPAKASDKPTSAALDAIRATLESLYTMTAGNVDAQNVLAKHLSSAVAAFHKEVKAAQTAPQSDKLDSVAA